MPTLKQKNRFKNIGKYRTVEEELLASGYAPSTAHAQHKGIVNGKGWNELLEKHLPDQELLTAHQKALHATKIHGSLTEPDRVIEDIPTQLKAVELGYKVKGKLKDTTVQFNAGEMTLEFIKKDASRLT